MSVHYKFKSALEYDTITFDGLHISVKDLKNAIVQQKRIGKNTDFDLQVTNAQTKEVYEDDQTLIPKNTSLLIARIPLAVQSKSKTWEGYGNDTNLTPRNDEGGPAAKAVDLSSLDASEDDKIRAMMSQSTQDYDPSKFITNYMKIRGANQVGAVPPNYRCYKCHQNGHWIKDCPLGQGSEQIEIKKSTGIPRSFMVPVDGPQVQGAMMTPYGSYAVPALDHQTYTQKQNPAPAPPPVQKTDIPEDLLCSICSDLLTDAVMIPCCGNSFCDECIRGILLESEDHECPDCHEREISPGTLIPNRFLRNSVTNFKSTTGYVKRQIYKPAMLQQQQQQQQPATIIKKDPVPVNETAPSVTAVADDVKTKKLDSDAENTEKTVISEADSTEAPKTPISEGLESKEEIKEPSEEKVEPVDLPPGVSPTREKSPVSVTRPIVINTTQQARDRSHTASVRPKSLNERSPRRSHKPHRSPQNYPEPIGNNEERPGTPTVDEPGMGGANNAESRTYPPTNAPYPSGPPPPPVVISSNINHMQVRQVPPPNYSQQPVSQYGGAQGIIPHGPPPNFRLPPPGAGAPPNFIPGMYNVQQRPMFDPTRPPMQGPHNYQNYSNRSRGRDYVPRGMRGRTPPGIIDDPLEAFNRMLREKDERERRAKQRKGRSYSRSSSRSYSRSPRRRSRSPRRRSRSKSFSMSRSRSRSYSPANRASPYRDYSPRRRPSSRYRSPQRSPNSRYRYKEERREREYERDRDHRDRDRERDRDRDRERDRGSGDYGGKREHRGYSRDRGGSGMSGGGAAPSQDYHYYDNFEAEKGRRGGGSSTKWVAPRESAYYHQQDHQNAYHQAGPQSSVQQHPASNRYMQQREQQYGGGGYKSDHIPSLMQQQIPSQRSRYEDVAPPGTEQPLPPGEEPSRYDERYNSYDNRPSVAAAVAGNQEQQLHQHQHRFSIDRDNHDSKYGMGKLVVEEFEKREEKRHSSKSPSRRSRDRGDKDRAHGEHMKSPDKHKHKDRSSKAEELSERRKDDKKKADYSDDEKSKRSRDKKKKRDKKESEKKKKRDKKEKREHRKEDKSKSKDESSSSKQHHEHHHAKEEKPKEEKRAMSPPPSKEGVGSSSPAPPVELKEAASSHHQIALADHHQTAEARENSPKLPEEEPDLYGDILSEGIDNTIVESYGKIDERSRSPVDRNRSPDHPVQLEMPKSPELLKESGDILELYTGELKSELDKEVLAPMPEKSKWELDDEPSNALSELNSDSKSDKANKVTNEVLKRAENAIFAKAINAIRPIEIKKISMDRVKLYSGEKEEKKEEEIKPEEFSENPEPEPVKQELEQQKPIRLSVKERLGCKVDDLDRIVRVEKNYDRNRSRSLSPLAKRSQDLRRIEIDNDKRRERPHHDSRDRDRHHRNYRNTERRDHERREHESKREHGSGGTSESRRGGGGGGGQEKERNRSRERRRERSRSRQRKDDDTGKREKRKRSRSRSDEKKQKKRDKKHQKKEKPKKHHRKEDEAPQSQQPPTSSTSQPLLTGNSKSSDQKTIDPEKILKRKTPLDEANFVPDYDAETESEGDQKKEKVSRGKSPEKRRVAKVAVDEKKESTSSDSSSSSSDDEKKKKKHKKHKKRKRRESTSSSSDSDSSSSEDEKDRRKKKHKKKQKKKKKSKHK